MPLPIYFMFYSHWPTITVQYTPTHTQFKCQPPPQHTFQSPEYPLGQLSQTLSLYTHAHTHTHTHIPTELLSHPMRLRHHGSMLSGEQWHPNKTRQESPSRPQLDRCLSPLLHQPQEPPIPTPSTFKGGSPPMSQQQASQWTPPSLQGGSQPSSSKSLHLHQSLLSQPIGVASLQGGS
jgi:hypothetical protein